MLQFSERTVIVSQFLITPSQEFEGQVEVLPKRVEKGEVIEVHWNNIKYLVCDPKNGDIEVFRPEIGAVLQMNAIGLVFVPEAGSLIHMIQFSETGGWLDVELHMVVRLANQDDDMPLWLNPNVLFKVQILYFP